jgi:hypothetical protein
MLRCWDQSLNEYDQPSSAKLIVESRSSSYCVGLLFAAIELGKFLHFSVVAKRGLYWSIFAVITALQLGCVTFARPRGEWYTPVDLELAADSLKDVVIRVECGKGKMNEFEFTDTFSTACQDLVSNLRSVGALVQADASLLPARKAKKAPRLRRGQTPPPAEAEVDPAKEQERIEALPTAFTMTYIDREHYIKRWGGTYFPDFTGCGLTIIPMILTGSYFPCIIDSVHQAEIRVTDNDNLVIEKRFLNAEGRGYYGIGGLLLLAWTNANPQPRLRDRREFTRRARTYILNAAYTSAIRMGVAPQLQLATDKLEPSTTSADEAEEATEL